MQLVCLVNIIGRGIKIRSSSRNSLSVSSFWSHVYIKPLHLKGPSLVLCSFFKRQIRGYKSTIFTLRKARERGHVLEGLAVALANIDEFIAIIRNAPTPPVAKAELMTRSWDSQLVREMLTRSRLDGGTINSDD